MRPWVALAACALLCACARSAAPVAPPGARRVLLDVPFHAERAKRGAPAALASVLSFWGRRTGVEELTEELTRDSFRGSLTGDLQRAAQSRGFSADMLDATLAQVRSQLDAGRPLIALLDEGPPLLRSGRYLVITGYDEDLHAFYAHTGATRHRLLPYESFFRRWARTRRCALVVRPAAVEAAR